MWVLEKRCPYCNGKQIKHGVTRNGKMRFKCIGCDKTQVKSYTYKAYSCHINPDIVELTKEGLGIRSTARFLQISPTTVIKRILKLSAATRICTDGLKNYRYLINSAIHDAKRYSTNHIERFNLTLRTHLKRLNGRTICFSRSFVLLNAILKIYFWL